MDINEVKKYVQNKIATDNITQKVRNVIKEKKWERQDAREGFKESFKPLIKPQMELNKQIKERNEQNNQQIEEIRANQLAITEGLRENRLALTEGLRAMKAIMDGERESDYPRSSGDEYFTPESEDEKWKFPSSASPSSSKPPKQTTYLNPEKNLDSDDIDIITNEGFVRPNNFGQLSEENLRQLLERTNKEIKFANGGIVGNKNKKNQTQEVLDTIIKLEKRKRVFKDYKNILEGFLISLQYQSGKGVYFNNPHQLLNRLELLAGSILAGNNGVIPEFSQLAHSLNQMNVITKKQLNDLLKSYIRIR